MPYIDKRRLYLRIAVRVLPFLFICYVLNFIDRVNIGFAKLQFLHDLGLTDASFGTATGLFFISYAAFELPSNLLLARVGACRTLMRIMVLWGICTVAQMFVAGATSLYLLRFLLGAAEAGFFPGLMLYLSLWFPDRIRARVNSALLLAVPIAGIAGGPLSGWIMTSMHDALGLRGWQWLFVLEGVPAIVLGLLIPLCLSDRPDNSPWLSEGERAQISTDIRADMGGTSRHGDHARLADMLRDGQLIGLAVAYFAIYIGLGAVTFWVPTVLRSTGVASVASIGWLSGFISVCTMIGNLAIAASSDRLRERRWHIFSCGIATAISLLLLGPAQGHVWATVALLSVAQLAIFTVPILYWTIPPLLLSGRSAAAGIAAISTFGSLGGGFSTWFVGALAARTGSPYAGLDVVAALLFAGMLLLLRAVPHQLRSPESTVSGRA